MCDVYLPSIIDRKRGIRCFESINVNIDEGTDRNAPTPPTNSPTSIVILLSQLNLLPRVQLLLICYSNDTRLRVHLETSQNNISWLPAYVARLATPQNTCPMDLNKCSSHSSSVVRAPTAPFLLARPLPYPSLRIIIVKPLYADTPGKS